MKSKLLILCLALWGVVGFTGCDDNDDVTNLPEVIENAFNDKFPDATWVEWERKAGYYVAEFRQDGMDVEAWYDNQGSWRMTESDFGRNLTLLPQAVQTTFQSSGYSQWTVDDIDKYECPDKTFYLIEVKKAGQRDRKLFYSQDGLLLKDVEDKENDDVLPTISF